MVWIQWDSSNLQICETTKIMAYVTRYFFIFGNRIVAFCEFYENFILWSTNFQIKSICYFNLPGNLFQKISQFKLKIRFKRMDERINKIIYDIWTKGTKFRRQYMA